MDDGRTDESLMAAYVAGDRRAFDSIFARYAPRIHGFFLRTFRSTAVADELLQMTFLRLHQARATFRTDASVRPWLWSIAANVRADELRRRQRELRLADAARVIATNEAAPVVDESETAT